MSHILPRLLQLRRHPSPRKEGFSRMIEWARSKGFDIDVR